MAAGGAKCWGNNEFGQVGVSPGDCATPCSTPVDVVTLGDHLMAITGGYFFTCALTSGGAVKCWGYNGFGQLGDSLACGQLCASPVNVTGLSSGVTGIATGSRHACARTTTGARCWGDNSAGELGDVGACGTSCPAPVDVLGLSPSSSGDVNCDRSVNSIDAALVLQLGAGLVHSLACVDAADVDHDGRTNSIDAALILQYSAGLLHTLP
jgi:alpha-tubulin suppressor-like RCC1 family protein